MPFSQLQGKRRSFREWLGLLMDAFMIRGTHSPMQWMLDLRTYGLRIHYNQTTPGHVGWMGHDELLYQQLHFTMGDFRGFTHGLVGATRRLLHDELLFGSEPQGASVPAIPWASLRDDPTQGKAGWNFLQDSRTQWPVDGTRWLMQRMQAEPAMQRWFIEAGAGRFRMRAIDTYMQRVIRFREKLSVAIHVVNQPTRNTS
jgi:hypothetical protein